MRQRDDLGFARLLNRLRLNEMTEDDKTMLQTHYVDRDTGDYPKDALHLFAENDFVVSANISAQRCQKLIQSLLNDLGKTGNLMKSLTIAIGMINVMTVNVNVEDGLKMMLGCS